MKPRFANLQTIVAVTFIALISSFAAPQAKAELKPKFDKLQLYNSPTTLPVIEVKAVGKHWTEVTTSKLNVITSYYVSLDKGKLMTISAIYAHYPIAKVRHTDGKWRKGEFTFELTNSQLGVVKNYAVNACNEKKKSGARTDETHSAFVDIPFNLFVRAERVGNQATKTVAGNVQAKVICKKAPKVLKISHLNVKYDKPNEKCPINAVVEVGFETNRNEPITFSLEHMNRGLNKTEYTAQPFLIDGQYVATKRLDLVVDKNTEYVQVVLKTGDGWKRWTASGNQEITCPPMKILSVWMTHKVHNPGFCPGKFDRVITVNTTAPDRFGWRLTSPQGEVSYAGGGTDGARASLEGTKYVYQSKSSATYNRPLDLQVMADIKNRDANSGWVPLKAACVQPTKVTLGFLDFKSPTCPRGAQAVAQIEADSPGPIAYQLDCASSKKSWSFEGIAEAKEHNSKYIAGLGHRLDITTTQHVNCALKRKSIDGFKIIALKGHKFQCVIKNPDVGEGPGGFKVDKPQPLPQTKPPVKDFGVKQPKCKMKWKTLCKTTPEKTCKKVTIKDCKKVPKTVCKIKNKTKCKMVPKRVCKIVRGEPVCSTVKKKQCEIVKENVCNKKLKTVCKAKLTTKCSVENKKTCKRVRKRVCPLKLKKRR